MIRYDVIYWDGSMDREVSYAYVERLISARVRAVNVCGRAGFADGTWSRADITEICTGTANNL